MSEHAGSRAAWIANYKRSAIDVETLERKIMSSIKDEDIQNYWVELKRNREESKKDTVKRVDGLRTVYYEIIDRLHESTYTIEHQSFQLYLESFETKLSSFKLAMRNEFDIFEDTEMNLIADIGEINQNIDSWASQHESMRQNEAQIKAEQRRRNQERQIKDVERKAQIGGIDRKIASLGRTGTWDPRDHDTFIRVWNQLIDGNDVQDWFNGCSANDPPEVALPLAHRNAVIKKATSTVPGKKSTDVDEHITWYSQYLYLTLAKKKVVQEWKTELMREKNKNNEEALVSEILDGKEALEDIHLAPSSPQQPETDRNAGENERQAAKARIAKWKVDRQKKIEQEEAEKQNNKLRERSDKDEDKKKRQNIIKAQLEKWKESEEENARLLALSQMKITRPKTADAAVLRSRQSRDLMTAKKRLQNSTLASQKLTERERTIAEAKVNVLGDKEIVRDVNRLWGDTKASEANRLTYDDLDEAERRRATGSAHSSKVAMTGRDLQFGGRAVPNWCKPQAY